MAKKYYWLKLKEDFFESDDIKLVESIPNGKDYIIFYLKLLCKSLKNDGILRYKNVIPYTPEMLSSITDTNIDIVNGALDKFKALNMIEFLDDGALFMTEIQSMLGSETSWAKTKRKQRKKVDNVQALSSQCPQNIGHCPTEIEKEIEKEIEIEIEREREADKPQPPAQKFFEFGIYKNVLLTEEQYSKLIEDYGADTIQTYIQKIDDWIVMKGRKPYKDFNLAIRKWLADDGVPKFDADCVAVQGVDYL